MVHYGACSFFDFRLRYSFQSMVTLVVIADCVPQKMWRVLGRNVIADYSVCTEKWTVGVAKSGQ